MLSKMRIRTFVSVSFTLLCLKSIGCDRPVRLLSEAQGVSAGPMAVRSNLNVREVTAALSDPNLGRSGLTCRHCHGSSDQKSARLHPHSTLEVTSPKADFDKHLQMAIGRCMELYLLRPSFTMPSALELSRYLAVAPPRRASTLDPSDGSSIFGRACAHCHDGNSRRTYVGNFDAAPRRCDRGKRSASWMPFRPKSRTFSPLKAVNHSTLFEERKAWALKWPRIGMTFSPMRSACHDQLTRRPGASHQAALCAGV